MAENSGGYIGNKPSDSSVTIARQAYTSTGITTDFTFRSGYTPGYLDAYLNGVRLIETDDYVATDGTTLSLSTAAQDGDTLELIAYKAFNVSEFTLETELGGNFNVSNDLTVGGNINLEGNLDLQDGDKILLGTGDDLQIYHNGTDTWIDNSQGDLYIRSDGAAGDDIIIRANDDVIIQAAQAEDAIIARGDGQVELYYNNSKKFETTDGGIDVTGHTETDTLNVSGVSTFSGNLNIGIGATVGFGSTAYFRDNAAAFFGNGGDLKIYHDGSNSYVSDVGTGGLKITGGDVYIRNISDQDMIHASSGSFVKLYHNNSEKLATTATGSIVTGILTATDFSGASGGAADFPNGLTGTTGTFSGNVSAVDGTFSGNVSIAGTLTYEDVTNIDSVGVITARNAVVISEDNAIHFRGTAADDADAILRASAGGGQLLINSRNDAIINIDSNNDSTDAHFAVAHGAATGSSTELLRVQENGLVGIGTDNPERLLSLKGSNAMIQLEGTGGNGRQYSLCSTDDITGAAVGTAGQFVIYDDTSGDDRFTITSDGKVGINQQTPTADLEVAGTTGTASTIFINAPTHSSSKISEAVLKFGYAHSGSPDAVAEIKLVEGSTNSFGGHLTFSVPDNNGSGGSSTSEILRIRSTGMVGINTTTGFDTSVGLAVRNGQSGSDHTMIDIIANTNETSRVVFSDDADHNQGRIQYNHIGNSLGFYTNGENERIHITSDGKVGINTQNPQAALEVAGTITQSVVEYPTIRPTLDLNFAATKTLDRRITFTRDSLATYYGEDGLLKYATNNTPRFDHDPDTRESLGLLIEHSSTNLISGSGGYGSDIRSGTNLGNAPTTEVVDGITLPDGTVGQVRRLQIHSSGNSGMRWGSTGGGNINTPYSGSVWARAVSGTASFSIDTNDQGNNAYNLTEEWVRMKVTGTTSEGAYQFLDIVGSANANGYFWGFQLENTPFVSSYIPVASNESNKTRAQDFATITGTNFTNFYNDTEGSLYSDFSLIGLDSAYNSTTVMITNNTTTNYLAIFGHNPVIPYAITGGSQQFSASLGGSSTTDVNYRAAMAYKLNDFAASLNGGTVSTDTSATIPPADRMLIGRRVTLNKTMNGYIRAIKYYNKRLPNAQLQGLTHQ